MAIGDSPAEIAGKAHLVTLRRALQVGVAAELMRQDVEPSRAFQAAWVFSDLADPLDTPGHMRETGMLFPSPALTLLIAYKGGPVASVIKRVDAKSRLDELRLPDPTDRRVITGGTFVWLNQVVPAIHHALEG
jgi:hypothetical protein